MLEDGTQSLFFFVFYLQNAKLKADQKLLINEMLKTAKVLEEKWDTEEMRKREDVVVVMKDYWEWQRQQEEEIEGAGYYSISI